MVTVAGIAAGITFLLVLWLLYLSPVAPVLKAAIDVLTDPVVSLVSTVVAFGVAAYVVYGILHMSVFLLA